MGRSVFLLETIQRGSGVQAVMFASEWEVNAEVRCRSGQSSSNRGVTLDLVVRKDELLLLLGQRVDVASAVLM